MIINLENKIRFKDSPKELTLSIFLYKSVFLDHKQHHLHDSGMVKINSYRTKLFIY